MSSEIEPIAAIAGFAAIGPIAPIRHIRLPPRVPAIEVGAYAVQEFKRCPQKTIEDTRIIAEGFADEMKSRGHKVKIRATTKEQPVSPKQWHTPTDQNRDGIDTVDMALLSSHGDTLGVQATGTERSGPPFWYYASCDSPDGCHITTLVFDPSTWDPFVYAPSTWSLVDPKKPIANMRLGDGKLRWLVLDTCRSLQIGAENEHEQEARTTLAKATPGRTWGRCYAGVHMLFGFTGLITIHFTLEKRGEAFGRRAGRGDLLSESWLDEAFSSRFDNFPVVTAFAQTPADLDRRLKSESLKKPGRASTQPIKSFLYSSMWRSA